MKFKLFIIIIVGILAFLGLNSTLSISVEHALTIKAVIYVAIFFMVIVGLVCEIVTPALVGLIGICVVAILHLVGGEKESIKWAISGFSSGTVWLVFSAYMFAKGYANSGLGKRIALILIKLLGKRTITMGYAVTFMELILGPFIPSNTARSAGTIFPIIKSIPPMYDSYPEKNRRKIGSYLMWIGFCAQSISGTLYLTGTAPNMLALGFVEKSLGIQIGWGTWISYTIIPFLTFMLLLPLIVYVIYPPKLKYSLEISIWASNELSKLGKFTILEYKMLALSLLALILWLFGGSVINHTTVALSVLVLMILLKVLSYEDVIGYKSAWTIFIFLACMVTLAAGLKTVGFLSWIGDISKLYLLNLDPHVIFISIIFIFFFSHYFFASITAHTVALMPIMISIGSATLPVDMHKPLFFALMFSLGLIGIVSPYATGPAPVWYGARYISSKEFWGLGLFFGILFFLVLLGLALFMV